MSIPQEETGRKKKTKQNMYSPVYHSKKQLLLKSGKSGLFSKKKKERKEEKLEPNKIPEIAYL